MANENRASYFIIGLTVLMGVLATAAVLIYIGGVGGRQGELLVESYYDKPVSGLSVGSAVNYRGVYLGEVRKISFVGDEYPNVKEGDQHRIYLLFAIKSRQPIFMQQSDEEKRESARRMVALGLRATVASSAITGMAHIEFDFASPEDAPSRPISWTPRHVLIPPKMSLLDNFSDSATKVMNQINRMDLNAFWSNVNASAESISAATLSTRRLLEGYQPEVERMMQNLEEATLSLKVFADEIRRNPSALIKDLSTDRLPETSGN